jgi:hypothetical protein
MIKKLLLGFLILGNVFPSLAQISYSVSVGVATVDSIRLCRNKIISKYFEFDATNTSDIRSNFQVATINNMNVSVLCQDSKATITVHGYDHNLVNKLMEEIKSIF